MRRGGENILGKVLLTGGHGRNAASTAPLRTINRGRLTFDITEMGERIRTFLLLDQILNIDLIRHIGNFGMPFITVFLFDLLQFLFHNTQNMRVARQNLFKAEDFMLQLQIFVIDFFLLQTGQAAQTHIDDCLRLRLIQMELEMLRTIHNAEQRDLIDPERLSHQIFLGIGFVLGRADNGNNAVNIIGCNLKTFENVGAVACFFQIEARAALNHILLECDVLVDDLSQCEHTRV